MSFLTSVLISIIGGYLALTSSLANFVGHWIPTQPQDEIAHGVPYTPEEVLVAIDSEYQTDKTIPDILLRNSSYQEAALYNGLEYPGATATDPRDALVNIYCTRRTHSFIRTTTGTGFFIHPNGVILTNAHVAQFLLLNNSSSDEVGEVTCTIRTGNPAVAQYEASLLYIPPSWIQEHANQIALEFPSGTGERDYALLYVTKGLHNQPLPAVFPALQVDPATLTRNVDEATVRAAGYPADALASDGPYIELRPRVATTTVSEIYTFSSGYADLFSIRGSAIGEHGSSGGPVIGPNGEVIGLITTRGDDETDGVGSLRAITAAHIDRTIREETGYSLQQNVLGDLPVRAQIFNETVTPFLTRILTTELIREPNVETSE